ncbi:HAMP domain protein, partial [Vibrio parahaemolyticus V-223/04]
WFCTFYVNELVKANKN